MAVLGVLREALALTYCAMCGNQLLRRSVLADIKKDVSALRSKADRGALFSGPDGVEMTESRSHREWLLSTQDKCAFVCLALCLCWPHCWINGWVLPGTPQPMRLWLLRCALWLTLKTLVS